MKIWPVEFYSGTIEVSYSYVFFQNERPTEEQLKSYISEKLDGYVGCSVYEIDVPSGSYIDGADIADFVSAYDIEYFVNRYCKERGWKLLSLNTFEVYIPE